MTSDKKNTYFTASIDKYFANWILKGTWYTDDPSDEKRFHEFVLAVHKKSRLVGGKGGMGKWVRDEEGNFKTDDRGGLIENGSRNPRTYQTGKLKANIRQAVKRNHTFDDQALERFASEFAAKAMVLLEFLWQTRNGLPDHTKSNLPLR